MGCGDRRSGGIDPGFNIIFPGKESRQRCKMKKTTSNMHNPSQDAGKCIKKEEMKRDERDHWHFCYGFLIGFFFGTGVAWALVLLMYWLEKK